MQFQNRRIFYGILVISIFILTALFTVYYNEVHRVIDNLKLAPFLIIISIVVGAGTYAFMSERIKRKVLSLKRTTELILKFLNENERKVVQKLIENNGKALQAEITRLPEMSKLRTHRAVKRLLAKNIIEVKKLGKTNVIRFPKDIEEGLL